MSLSPLPNTLERDYSSTITNPRVTLCPPIVNAYLFCGMCLHLLCYIVCYLLFCFIFFCVFK
ncbi:hypothetical protein JHK86_004178 [Glycine max]|nr:hypothetical protein JHK86_004178 [Glycine max]